MGLIPSAVACTVFLVTPLLPAQTGTEGPVKFGDASGEPGEIVEVPVRATYQYPLLAFFSAFQYDASRLEFLRYDVKGTLAEDVEPNRVSARIFDPGDAIFGLFDSGAPWQLMVQLPPGEEQLIGKLLFRVRADAEPGTAFVNPVKKIPQTAGITGYTLVYQGGIHSFLPEELIGGQVNVLPPTGLRPVGSLECTQFLDRVRISFLLTETYDGIEISRDGTLLATLAGTATEYTDPLVGTGKKVYSVRAQRAGEYSLPISCELLAVSPAAPSVEDLSCGEVGLSWVNPLVYDRIVVFRDGQPLADLPGDSEEYVDPGRPDSLTVYTVVGELEGFRSPESNCLDHGIWIMEVGDVEAPVDAELVMVPIFVTTSATIRGMSFCLEIDTSHFDYLRDKKLALKGTVGEPDPEFLATGGIGACGFPTAAIIYDSNPPREEEKDFRPGLRQHVLNFPFRPVGPISQGDTFQASFITQGDGRSIFSDDSGFPIFADLIIPGQIRFGSTGLKRVKNLQTKVKSPGAAGGGENTNETDVRLSWENGSPYEAIRIERNGEPVAELPGASTEYLDPRLPRGLFIYKVVGIEGERSSFPASTFLSTVVPRGAFLRGDATRDHVIDITDPLAVLTFLFLSGGKLSCQDAADANDDGSLTLTDPIVMLNFLFLGTEVLRAPGSKYPWFDPTPDDLTCDE